MFEDCYVSSPRDAIVVILLKLPVKSLLIKFKSVCKGWKALIEDPIFVTEHFNQETNSTQLLVQCIPEEKTCYTYVLFNGINSDCTPCTHEDLDLHFNGYLFGPFSGTFLVHTLTPDGVNDCLTLWNPSTREWKPLPTPDESPFPPDYHPDSRAFGLGKSRMGNEFKIIWFRTYKEEYDFPNYYGLVISIYTLSDNTWRYVDFSSEYSFVPINSSCNTYINGVYYWVLNYDVPILAFDMSSEAFYLIPGPAEYELRETEYHYKHPKLALYGDTLAIFLVDYSLDLNKGSLSTLVRMDDGSWMKLFTIGPFTGYWRNHLFWTSYETLLENGDEGRLLIYNTDTGETKDLGLVSGRDKPPFTPYCYKESLFSAKRSIAAP